METLPLEPAVVVPEVKLSVPLTPLVPEFAVAMTTLPLLVPRLQPLTREAEPPVAVRPAPPRTLTSPPPTVPSPAPKNAEPPLPAVVAPARTETAPPAPAVPLPTAMLTLPAEPPERPGPVTTLMLPLETPRACPVERDRPPLAPRDHWPSEVKMVMSPLAEDELLPLPIETDPPVEYAALPASISRLPPRVLPLPALIDTAPPAAAALTPAAIRTAPPAPTVWLVPTAMSMSPPLPAADAPDEIMMFPLLPEVPTVPVETLRFPLSRTASADFTATLPLTPSMLDPL